MVGCDGERGLIERSSGRAGRGTKDGGVLGTEIGQTSRDQFAPVRAPDSDPDSTRPPHTNTCVRVTVRARARCSHTYRRATPSIFPSRCPCTPCPFFPSVHSFPSPPPFPGSPGPRARWHPPAKRYSSQKVALCRSVSRPPQKFHAYLDRRHHLFAPR